MTQYVVQIQIEENGLGIGWLAKCFEVSAESPIPGSWPTNREQIVMTNTNSFNAIVAVYDEYTTNAIFSYDERGAKIDCTGAVTDSWPIN